MKHLRLFVELRADAVAVRTLAEVEKSRDEIPAADDHRARAISADAEIADKTAAEKLAAGKKAVDAALKHAPGGDFERTLKQSLRELAK